MVINTPRINLSIKTQANLGLSEQRVLFIMPYDTTEYKKDVDINTLNDSHLKNMMLKFRELNKLTKLSYLSVEPALVNTNATATLTILSGITEATNLKIYLLDSVLEVIIPANSSIQAISDLILAKLITSNYVESATANVTFEEITIELSNLLAGALGNGIYFSTSNLDLITTTAFIGGTPYVTYDLSLLGEDRFQHIICSNVFDANPLATFLKNRFNTEFILLDGVGAKAYKTPAEVELEGVENCQCLVQLTTKKAISHIDTFSTIFMALRSLRFTAGANLSELVDVSAGTDNFVGGIGLSAIPYHNTNLTEYLQVADVYGMQDSLDIEGKRITLIDKDVSGVLVSISDTYTSYKIDDSGNADDTYKYLNNVDIALNVREYFYTFLKARTKMSVLALGVGLANRGQLSVEAVRTLLIRTYIDLISFGIVQDEISFKENLIVVINNVLGKIQVQYTIYPTQGVRSIDGTLIVKI
jgi:phage tail sheath gpL-like